jgi:hypothetical protein
MIRKFEGHHTAPLRKYVFFDVCTKKSTLPGVRTRRQTPHALSPLVYSICEWGWKMRCRRRHQMALPFWTSSIQFSLHIIVSLPSPLFSLLPRLNSFWQCLHRKFFIHFHRPPICSTYVIPQCPNPVWNPGNSVTQKWGVKPGTRRGKVTLQRR